MTPMERIARSALSGDAVGTRALVQDWLEGQPSVSDEPPPAATADATTVALTAALAELWADRLGQRPPPWAGVIGAAPEPVFLLLAARRMRHLREICEAEAPLPLRRRGFFAPANYLEGV